MRKKTKKKLGFALGAGGSRGIAHIGFLKAMEEEGIKPDYIAGCSMGSIVGGAYASGVRVEDMEQAVRKLRLLQLLGGGKRPGGLFETKKIRKILSSYIGDVDFSDLKTPFCCVAVDLYSQKVVEFSTGSVLDGVVASSSIPGVFKPTEKNGMLLVDGGLLARVPCEYVKNMGAEVVVAVDVLGNLATLEKKPSTITVLLESYNIMDNYRTAIRRKEQEKIIDFWLEPPLGTMNQYSLKQLEFALEEGYKLGKENAEKIKKAIEG